MIGYDVDLHKCIVLKPFVRKLCAAYLGPMNLGLISFRLSTDVKRVLRVFRAVLFSLS